MILDDIIFNKRQEVTSLKVLFSGKDPKKLTKGIPRPRNFMKAFQKGRFSLIAELKKASPSAGIIRQDFEPITLAKAYEESGAAALSVLTDEKFFQGKLENLKLAKESTIIPILRKDFIIDECQVLESRLAGADALLLIARVLEDPQLARLIELTESMGMQALVEVHNAEEIERVLQTPAKIIGINNRDLDTFEVNLQNAVNLIKKFPKLKERIVIAESGVERREHVEILKKAGVDGVLIGETLLRSKNIPDKVRELMG